jgi:hypothetical protein
MGLITIGGQSAYIIDSKPAEVGRTSTGTGYAQLVSQQRWKIWEEAQKSVLRQMEFEKMGYEAQLDAFKKQKEQLNKALLKAEEIKTKVKNGSMGMGEALRLSGQLISYGKSKYERDRVDVTSSERQAVDKFTGLPLFEEDGVTPVMLVSGSEKSRRYKDKEGDPLPESIDPITALRQAQGALGVETPAERKRASVSALEAEWKKGFANRTDKSLDAAAWAKSEGKEIDAKLAAEKAKPVSDFSQDEAKKEEAVSGLDERIAEIQAEIDALSAPEVGFDTNVLSRTREAFGGMAGVGGLGFAPRRSKISPIYDEGRAREAMAAQRTGAEQAIALAASKNEADLRASVLDRKKATSRERIRELTVARGLASGDEAAAIDEAIAKLSAEPTLTAQEELSVRTSSRNAALEDFRNLSLETGPGPRTRREFMDREPSGTKDFPIDDLKKEYIAALRKASLAEDPEVEEEPPPRIAPDAPAAPAGSTQQRSRRPPEPTASAPVSSDLDIFRRITEEEEEITLPPVPPLIPQSMTPDAPPPLKGAGPGSLPYQEDPPLIFGGGVIDQEEPAAAAAPPKVSDTDIEIAETNDPDVYKKAFEYWKTSSNPEIAKDPPAYFAGPQPGGRKPPPSAGQKEMVRAYLEQYEEETDNEDKIRIKGGKLDPDLAREAEGEVANLYKKASSIDSYLEKMDPTEQEKQELYNAYQDRIKDDRLMSDRDLADLYIEKLTEMREKKDKPKAEGSQGSIKKPKTRSEVYASNLLKIINTGKTLADKPAKLARIAKPDLPEKERSKVVPEHILLVDKLYNINKGRSSAFKSTYDEIERVYKTDEKKKKAALEYLAAKEILTSEMA